MERSRVIHDDSSWRPQPRYSPKSPVKRLEHSTCRRHLTESPMTQQHDRSHETDTRLVAFKSFMWCVVDRLDSCTKLCTTACGREEDVLHSPPSKQRHFSNVLPPLQVATNAEDVQHFCFSGGFRNDGTFPVSDEELLDARYHSLDADSEVSVAMTRKYDARHGRGVLREYFERCADESCCSTQYSGHSRQRHAQQQVPCHITTKTAQVPGLSSGRG